MLDWKSAGGGMMTIVAQTATGRLTYLSDQVVPRGGIFGNFGLRIELLSAFRNVSLRVGGRDGYQEHARDEERQLTEQRQAILNEAELLGGTLRDAAEARRLNTRKA